MILVSGRDLDSRGIGRTLGIRMSITVCFMFRSWAFLGSELCLSIEFRGVWKILFDLSCCSCYFFLSPFRFLDVGFLYVRLAMAAVSQLVFAPFWMAFSDVVQMFVLASFNYKFDHLRTVWLI